MSYEIDDDTFPGTAVVYIETTWRGVTYTGSGVLVGRNDVLTASHVIYNASRGGLADRIVVYPSFDPDALNNKSFTPKSTQYFTDWDADGDGLIAQGDGLAGSMIEAEVDIALLTMSDPIGDQYGWFGIDWRFKGGAVGVIGHPGVYGRNMIYDSGTIEKDRIDQVFHIASDLEINPGNSGGPIYYNYSSGNYVVAIVSTAETASSIGDHFYWLDNAIRNNDSAIPSAVSNVGNDVFAGGAGKSLIDGGPGFDIVQYSAKLSNYKISLSNGNVIVQDRTGLDGRNELIAVEQLKFVDRSLDLTMLSKAQKISAANLDKLVELYVAYFNRAPEASGLSYWIDQVSNGKALSQVSKDFYAAGIQYSAVTGYSAAMANSDFITTVYKNVLGRSGVTAPNAQEVDYWNQQMSSGVVSRDSLISRMLSDARAFESDPQWGWVTDYLENKVLFSKYHAVTLGLDYASADVAITETVKLVGMITPTSILTAVNAVALQDLAII